jgi:hypothetical protein
MLDESPATTMRIECTECHFSTTEEAGGETLPADIVKEHGRETGHSLSVSPVDGNEPPAESTKMPAR